MLGKLITLQWLWQEIPYAYIAYSYTSRGQPVRTVLDHRKSIGKTKPLPPSMRGAWS